MEFSPGRPPLERPHRHHGQPRDGPTCDPAVGDFVDGDRVDPAGAGQRERTVPRGPERRWRVGIGELAPLDEQDDVLFGPGERRERSRAHPSAHFGSTELAAPPAMA